MQTDTKHIFNENVQMVSTDAVQAKQPPLAYIRELSPVEGEGYAICSDEGKVLASFSTYESAFFTARQFRLTPLAIH